MEANPEQILILESSTFKLGQNCFRICATPSEIIASASSSAREKEDFDKKFNACIHHCTVGMIQTKQYLKERFLRDLDSVVEQNQKVYTSFYS